MRHIFVVGCAVAIGVLLVFYFVHRTQSSVSTKQPPEESTTIRFMGDDSAGSSESVSSVSVVGDTKRNVIVQNEQRIRDMSVPLPTNEDMQVPSFIGKNNNQQTPEWSTVNKCNTFHRSNTRNICKQLR